jgi:hypothetical protein
MKKRFSILALSILAIVLMAGLIPTNAVMADQSGKSASKSVSPVCGLWNFNHNTMDKSGNKNDGVIHGTAKYVDGVIGKSLYLDGNTYVDCGNGASLRPANALTVDAWVKYSAFLNDDMGHAVICESNLWPELSGFALYQATVAPYNRFKCFVVAGTPPVAFYLESPTLLSKDKWYQITMTYNGSFLKLYINGKLDTSTSTPSTGPILYKTPFTPFYIGTTYNPDGTKYEGAIDQVCVLNKALNASDIMVQHIFHGVLHGVWDMNDNRNRDSDDD